MKELVCEELSQVRNWRDELIASLKLSNSAENTFSLDDSAKQRVKNAKQRFPLMVPLGYANLVDWQNPADPLRQLLLPSEDEENDSGSLDTSGEEFSTVIPGLQHKYEQTAVLIVTQACAGHCRYCFRRRLMSRDVMLKETIEYLQEAIHQ